MQKALKDLCMFPELSAHVLEDIVYPCKEDQGTVNDDQLGIQGRVGY